MIGPRHRICLLTLLSACLCAAFVRLPAGEHPEPGAFEPSQWTAVGALNGSEFKIGASCTGALVAPDLVLTAAHCAQPAGEHGAPQGRRFFLAGLDGDRYVVKAVSAELIAHPAYAYAKGNMRFFFDVALVRLAEPIAADKVTPLRITQADMALTGPFALVGYSRTPPFVLSGQFDCARLNDTDDRTLVTDCAVVGGNSGAPVLERVDDGWQIVAVTVARLGKHWSGKSIAVPIPDWVRDRVSQSEAREQQGNLHQDGYGPAKDRS